MNADNQFFNEQWQLYQKVLNNNYMGHKEIYSILHDFLINHLQTPFSLLDLGCGDASFTTKSLFNTSISAYKGIDLSAAALEIAQRNLEAIPCKKTFIQDDISTAINQLVNQKDDKFDVVMTSFALHHLSLEEKESVISQISHLLESNGILIIVDVIRLAEEERENFIKRYLNHVRKDWYLISSQEYSMIENHISTCDFPETQNTLSEITRKHNFPKFECLYQDDFVTTQVLCFYKTGLSS
ncbi:class I SAM-dependent methyltransferase [Calothrix rhizosoleniae]|uniref:class I SAM-dependent methyltransferase n=1 Tax=Calothrix rhizosoleniae TaxID=888997 RepID=UPI00190E6E63|nr:class I SAM-dependent methyltransferase [Calothrix rhizosoleniae]